MAVAAICMARPNFFILDEPTNHLDIETIEALGHAINRFNVSHARRRRGWGATVISCVGTGRALSVCARSSQESRVWCYVYFKLETLCFTRRSPKASLLE